MDKTFQRLPNLESLRDPDVWSQYWSKNSTTAVPLIELRNHVYPLTKQVLLKVGQNRAVFQPCLLKHISESLEWHLHYHVAFYALITYLFCNPKMTTGNDWTCCLITGTKSYTFMYLNSNPHFDWWLVAFNKMILRQSSWRCSQMLSRFFFKWRWHFILVCALLLMAVLLRCQSHLDCEDMALFSPKASSIWNIISGSLVFNTFQKLAREQQWLG